MRIQLEGEVSVVVLDFLVRPLTQFFLSIFATWKRKLGLAVYGRNFINGPPSKKSHGIYSEKILQVIRSIFNRIKHIQSVGNKMISIPTKIPTPDHIDNVIKITLKSER